MHLSAFTTKTPSAGVLTAAEAGAVSLWSRL